MRLIMLAAGVGVAFVCTSCGGSTPVSPSAVMPATVASDTGAQAGGSATSAAGSPAAAVGLSGVIRGLNAGSATFTLVTRGGTRTILTNGETQVWSTGTQTRLSALRNGQSVSIRGYDYARYVLARTIGVN